MYVSCPLAPFSMLWVQCVVMWIFLMAKTANGLHHKVAEWQCLSQAMSFFSFSFFPPLKFKKLHHRLNVADLSSEILAEVCKARPVYLIPLNDCSLPVPNLLFCVGITVMFWFLGRKVLSNPSSSARWYIANCFHILHKKDYNGCWKLKDFETGCLCFFFCLLSFN